MALRSSSSDKPKKPRGPRLYTTQYPRVTAVELQTFQRIRPALGRPISQIAQAGIIEAAHRLGFYAGGVAPKTPYKRTWPDLPHRAPDETGVSRLSIVLDPDTQDLLLRTSVYVGVDPHPFIIGATLRYLSRLKQHDPDGRFAGLPLPPQFEP